MQHKYSFFLIEGHSLLNRQQNHGILNMWSSSAVMKVKVMKDFIILFVEQFVSVQRS